MALYMVMVADEDDMDRFIMPVSDSLEHMAMLKTLDLYHEKMAGNDGGAFYFAGPNPGLAKGKPAGMSMADYVYGKVSHFAIQQGVKVINPATL